MNKIEQLFKKSTLRNLLRNWLLDNPKLNPYEVKKPGIFRAFTSAFRVIPNFLIIGAGKSGTTSLYNNLIEHPNIYPASKKEIKYFSRFQHGRYRSHFPTKFLKFYITKICKKQFLTGEASTEYMFSKEAATRVHKNLLNVKLIVILRNPVDRTYSEYNDLVNYHNESKSFEDIIVRDIERLQIHDKKNENLFDEWNPNIVFSSLYVNHLKVWMNFFPREQFLILDNNNFKTDPQKVLNTTFEFLGLPSHKLKEIEKHNVGKYGKPTMDSLTRRKLIEFFKPYNERLYTFLGERFDWDG